MQSDRAVESMTRRPRSRASRCVICVMSLASGSRLRVGVVHPVVLLLGHEEAFGPDLQRAQSGGGVGGEERVAGAGREDHHPALLQVADGPAPDIGLADLLHVDGRQHPRVDGQLRRASCSAMEFMTVASMPM